MALLLCPQQALGTQCLIELVQTPCLAGWRKQSPPNGAYLVLHLALLPAGSGRAGNRFKKIMTGQFLEAAVEVAFFATQDTTHGGLHVVVDATPGDTAEELKGSAVGVEHHLL